MKGITDKVEILHRPCSSNDFKTTFLSVSPFMVQVSPQYFPSWEPQNCCAIFLWAINWLGSHNSTHLFLSWTVSYQSPATFQSSMFEKPLDNCSWVPVSWKKMQLVLEQDQRKICPGNPTPRWHDLTKLNRFSRLKVGTRSLDCLALSGTFAPTIIFIFAFFLYFLQF